MSHSDYDEDVFENRCLIERNNETLKVYPENAANIPEVAELIKEAQSMVDKVGNDYSTSWLEDALKPFKGG